MLAKAQGHDFGAVELQREFCNAFGRHEIEIERYCDHTLSCRTPEHIVRAPKGLIPDGSCFS